MNLQRGLFDLALVSLLAALTPFRHGTAFPLPGASSGDPHCWRGPDRAAGPRVGPIRTASSWWANLGLGFLFLLAGYELELGKFRQRAGRLAHQFLAGHRASSRLG